MPYGKVNTAAADGFPLRVAGCVRVKLGVRWSRAGFQFWAISDVGSDDLKQFVGLLQTRAAPESK